MFALFDTDGTFIVERALNLKLNVLYLNFAFVVALFEKVKVEKLFKSIKNHFFLKILLF